MIKSFRFAILSAALIGASLVAAATPAEATVCRYGSGGACGVAPVRHVPPRVAPAAPRTYSIAPRVVPLKTTRMPAVTTIRR